MPGSGGGWLVPGPVSRPTGPALRDGIDVTARGGEPLGPGAKRQGLKGDCPVSDSPAGPARKGPDYLLIGILAGILLGALFGGAFPQTAVHVKFMGDLFIHALMLMVVPLVVASMVVGISNLGDIRTLGAIGARTIGIFLFSTALAVLLGLALVYLIQPGQGLSSGEGLPQAAYRIEGDRLFLEGGARFSRTDYDQRYLLTLADQPVCAMLKGRDGSSASSVQVEYWRQWRWLKPWQASAVLGVSEDELWDQVQAGHVESRELAGRTEIRVLVSQDEEGQKVVPSAQGTGVNLELPVAQRLEGKQRTILDVLVEVLVGLVPTNLFKAMAEAEVLPLILFSLVLGGVLSTMGESGRPVLAVFQGLNDAIMQMVHLLMYTAPLGVFGLIAARLGEAGGWMGFLPELTRLAAYTVTVLAGLGIHSLVTLPVLLILLTRRSPLPFLTGMMPALTTAFSTASSSATLPLTMECLKGKLGVSARTTSFVAPLGATVNMNGTALFQAVAAVFIAQMHEIPLEPVSLFLIFLTATLAAVGAAGIPEAGLVTLVIVLKAAGLPITGITMILVIDWFLDRCRTAVNIWGDAVAAAVVDRFEKAAGPPEDPSEAKAETAG